MTSVEASVVGDHRGFGGWRPSKHRWLATRLPFFMFLLIAAERAQEARGRDVTNDVTNDVANDVANDVTNDSHFLSVCNNALCW